MRTQPIGSSTSIEQKRKPRKRFKTRIIEFKMRSEAYIRSIYFKLRERYKKLRPTTEITVAFFPKQGGLGNGYFTIG